MIRPRQQALAVRMVRQQRPIPSLPDPTWLRMRNAMSEDSVAIDDRESPEGEVKASEKAEIVAADVSNFRDIIRNELRRGKSQ
jgi:hypothetical protein